MQLKKMALACVAVLGMSATAWADINVGVTLSATGPAASLGIPEKNTISLLPTSIGGQKVNYIVLDDASDTTAAVTNTRKLISERNVDVIIGSSTTPASLAMIDAVAEAKTPMITLGASAAIIEPQDAKKKWVIFIEQNLGPHMLQKCAVLLLSFGRVSSWKSRAVSGSSPRLNWSSQRNSKRALLIASSRARAAGWPFATSAACAAIL